MSATTASRQGTLLLTEAGSGLSEMGPIAAPGERVIGYRLRLGVYPLQSFLCVLAQ